MSTYIQIFLKKWGPVVHTHVVQGSAAYKKVIGPAKYPINGDDAIHILSMLTSHKSRKVSLHVWIVK